MQSEKVLDFLKRKGTLGVCALGLVGAMAFASYRTSTPRGQEDNLAMLEETEVHRDVLQAEETDEADAEAETADETDAEAETADETGAETEAADETDTEA